MHGIVIIFKKELKDILRDTRALFTVSLVSILAGPILLIMISNMLASFEARSERRIIVVYGIENAPSLANHLAIETAQIENAPLDCELALQEGRLLDPVLVIPSDFEEKWENGEPQTLKLVTNSSNSRANAGVSRVKRWVSGFSGGRAALQLAVRSGSTAAGNFINIEDIDLASAQAETAKVFGMLPYFFVLAALYGVWGSALDTTVGEKERGTLESLLVTPNSLKHIAFAKWLAVSFIGSIIASIAVLSFIPAQMLMQSDTLKAMFNFGWIEVGISLMLIIPLVGFFAVLLMLVGTYAKNTRQAQANSTAVLLITAFLPMMIQLNSTEHNQFYMVMPVIAQHHFILNLLKGENIQYLGTMISVAITIIMISFMIIFVAKNLSLSRAS